MADFCLHPSVPLGPRRAAAQLEGSKKFAHDFMARHNVPTSRWRAFTDVQTACDHIDTADYPALVVKADGLAAGKGVVVAATKAEAKAAVRGFILYALNLVIGCILLQGNPLVATPLNHLCPAFGTHLLSFLSRAVRVSCREVRSCLTEM